LIAIDLQARLTRSNRHVADLWLVPIKDVLQFALWVCAFAGRHVEWRGERMRLRRDGMLVRREHAPQHGSKRGIDFGAER
jgi:hypothetical protein